jgi:hypothetical protein
MSRLERGVGRLAPTRRLMPRGSGREVRCAVFARTLHPGDVTVGQRLTNPQETYFDEIREGPGIWKWRHYFDIYDPHLRRFRGQPANIVAVGVSSGGSLGRPCPRVDVSGDP